ncbi:hypothetical protein Glove_230g57 [Diversispora epigaea]|uniref:Protein kinase domain-containing protein n=1 Tax=Diversispora epigaea TaxID=1348612 RepID=A0A397ILG9_9GLOM|nr:hypothetical protein Glove_230g57 [Diversispora epigaea]
MSSKKVSFESALKNNYIKKFDYTKFENIERIASGGFGTVYRAKSLILRKLVALKCLHGDDESFFEKFVKEKNTSARLPIKIKISRGDEKFS